MVQWVEEGVAPDTLTAANYVGNNVSNGVGFTRPLCRVRLFPFFRVTRGWVCMLMSLFWGGQYPTTIRYKGGDPDSADSFECA